jgi:hypothetical protein
MAAKKKTSSGSGIKYDRQGSKPQRTTSTSSNAPKGMRDRSRTNVTLDRRKVSDFDSDANAMRDTTRRQAARYKSKSNAEKAALKGGYMPKDYVRGGGSEINYGANIVGVRRYKQATAQKVRATQASNAKKTAAKKTNAAKGAKGKR